MKTLSARVRLARRAAQLTQAEVANLLGVGRSAVAQWERAGGSRPSVSHLTSIAQKLDCSFEWLATGRGGRASMENGDAEPAVILRYFAHDDDEDRILAALRDLDACDRAMVLSLAEALVEKALSSRKPKPNR